MRILNNNYYYQTNFKAGLTKQMRQEILSCKTEKITQEFFKHGIPTDFKNNKVIAWGSLKCLELINYLNKQFNLNLSLPKGVFVEDFCNLEVRKTGSTGFCNLLPSELYQGSEEVVSENTIFFNSSPVGNETIWENIDAEADRLKAESLSETDFFLDIFLHEFAHAMHGGNIIKKMGFRSFENLMESITTRQFYRNFQEKYSEIIENSSCSYATSHPMETIACDLPKRIIDSLNKDTLVPTRNFAIDSPYLDESLTGIPLSPCKDEMYEQMIKRFWNGEFK